MSSNATMQLTETDFPDSAILIEKKREVENWLWWGKSEFLWQGTRNRPGGNSMIYLDVG